MAVHSQQAFQAAALQCIPVGEEHEQRQAIAADVPQAAEREAVFAVNRCDTALPYLGYAVSRHRR